MHAALDLLTGHISSGDRIAVLTGAGVSTDSGIPDYRGPGAPARRPMTYGEFVSGPGAQQRYWARSYVGWTRMHRAEPNPSHHALAALEAGGGVEVLVTQNVDGLHERAGSRTMCALHGRVAYVVCLGCGRRTSREGLQGRMRVLNPGFADRHASSATRPDGDVALDETAAFRVPACDACGGVLKPDVVFFGENVPKPRVLRCLEAVERSAALLVAGSSLTVLSGFRFVRHADRLGIPVVIVNRGPTRGDELAAHKMEAGCADFLTALVTAVPRRGGDVPVQETPSRTDTSAPSPAGAGS